MPSYKLRDRTSNTVYTLEVGYYTAWTEAYNKSGSGNDRISWNSVWLKNNTNKVIIHNYTSSIFEQIPYDILFNELEFVNDTRFHIQAISKTNRNNKDAMTIELYYNNVYVGAAFTMGTIITSEEKESTDLPLYGNVILNPYNDFGSVSMLEPSWLVDTKNEVIMVANFAQMNIIGSTTGKPTNNGAYYIGQLNADYYIGKKNFTLNFETNIPTSINPNILYKTYSGIYSNSVVTTSLCNIGGTYYATNKILYDLLFDKTVQEFPYENPNNPDDGNGGNNGGNINGGDGTFNNDTDNIELPNGLSQIANTDIISVYQVQASTLKQFASYIWNDTFVNAIAKLFDSPMQAIISLKAYNFSIAGNSNAPIVVGNIKTPITATKITQDTVILNMGTITIEKYYGDAHDFAPYTSIDIYLPFIGMRQLSTDDVMGMSITLQYNIDILTGACVANIKVTGERNGTNLNSTMYSFNGTCGSEVPLSSQDMTGITTALLGVIVGSATSKNVDSMLNSAMKFHINYERTGNLGANLGQLSVLQPYIVIHRPITIVPDIFAHEHGLPYYKSMTLGFSGFTKVQDVFIDGIIGTPEETEEIKRLLKSGVIF